MSCDERLEAVQLAGDRCADRGVVLAGRDRLRGAGRRTDQCDWRRGRLSISQRRTCASACGCVATVPTSANAVPGARHQVERDGQVGLLGDDQRRRRWRVRRAWQARRLRRSSRAGRARRRPRRRARRRSRASRWPVGSSSRPAAIGSARSAACANVPSGPRNANRCHGERFVARPAPLRRGQLGFACAERPRGLPAWRPITACCSSGESSCSPLPAVDALRVDPGVGVRRDRAES